MSTSSVNYEELIILSKNTYFVKISLYMLF